MGKDRTAVVTTRETGGRRTPQRTDAAGTATTAVARAAHDEAVPAWKRSMEVQFAPGTTAGFFARLYHRHGWDQLARDLAGAKRGEAVQAILDASLLTVAALDRRLDIDLAAAVEVCGFTKDRALLSHLIAVKERLANMIALNIRTAEAVRHPHGLHVQIRGDKQVVSIGDGHHD